MGRIKHIFLALFSAAAMNAAGIGAQTSHSLPDIGDPAAASLPLSQEKRLTPIILRQLRSQLPMIEDVELNEYLSSLGNQLLSASRNNQLNFHFLLVNQPQINAFATPGGIIAINSGLMLAAESESELAGVLAHEITHVTQRHLARLLSETKKMGWVGYLAAIGAVLASAYDSRLAQLGTYAGLALPVERTLSYYRTFEHEADRIGMQLMVAAGYDPAGMPKFFKRLQSREGAGGAPEFLRTHPLTAERLSDALNRAALYRGKYRSNSEEFTFAKARLEALTGTRRPPPGEATRQTPVERYRRAIVLTRTGGAREATQLLERIPDGHETVATGLALAEAHLAQGNHHAAIGLLKSLNDLHPGRESIAYVMGEALLRADKPDAALSLLRPFANRPHAPILDKLIAQAAAADDKAWLSHKHLADYHQANGRMQAALEQLALADKDAQISQPAREVIKVQRSKIRKLQREMREGQ